MKQTANYTALSNLLKLITEKDCLGYYKEKADAVAITEKLCELAQFDLDDLQSSYTSVEEFHANFEYADELQEMLEKVFGMVLENEHDFNIEFNGERYRIIHEGCINSIFEEECEEYAIEKYADIVESLPHTVQCAIDYKKIVLLMRHDGYGYGDQFANYDSYEHNVGDYFMFRVS